MTSRFFGAASGAATCCLLARPLCAYQLTHCAGDDTAVALLARLRALQRTRPESSSDGFDCAICLGSTPRGEAATLDCCTHRFCFDCIEAWTKQTSSCPLCKRVVARLLRANGESSPVEARQQRVDWLGDDALFFDEEEEATPCQVCGRDDEAATLLLCDGAGCSGACHVACAGLPAVPAGDWLCARCAPPLAEAAPAET